MRKADVDDAWSHCRAADRQALSIESILFRGPSGTESLRIRSRVTALLGSNGVGKTGSLRALENILSAGHVGPARSSIFGISGSYQGNEFHLDGSGARPPEGLKVAFSDVSLEVHLILDRYRRIANLEDFIQPFGEKRLSAGELDLYRHVTCQPYLELYLREVDPPREVLGVEESEEDENPFPFFRAVTATRQYDSRTMGFGEYCACYLIWLILRTGRRSVILLDEPDSHLSAASRRGLIDVLAVLANDKKLAVFFSSHSAEPLYAMEERDLCLVYRGSDTTQPTVLANVDQRRHIVRPLRLVSSKCLLAVVEDVDALEALQQIATSFEQDLSRWVDMRIVRGGADCVATFVGLFPTDSAVCGIVGVLDGDSRTGRENVREIAFLPGHQDPKAAARTAIYDAPQPLASRLRMEVDALILALREIEYRDHHDFPRDLREALGLDGYSVERLRSEIVAVWLELPEVVIQSQELARRLFELAVNRPFSDR